MQKMHKIEVYVRSLRTLGPISGDKAFFAEYQEELDS